MFTCSWTLGVVLLAGCGPLPPPQPPSSVPVTVATLAVLVTDAAGVARPGAHVTLHTGESGETNADGYLAFEGLVLGERTITITLDGYRDTHVFADPFVANLQVPVRLVKVVVEPPAPTPPQHPNPLVGELRIVGHAFADDTGYVLPVYEHAGDLFSVYVRDPHRARDQLDKVAAAGYHGIRTWGTLGCGSATVVCAPTQIWGGQEVPSFWYRRDVGPELTPNYWTQVEGFFHELAQRGLRAVWSQGDIGQLRDRRAYMTRLVAAEASVLADFPNARVADWVDCGNESYQTGEPDPARLAQCVGYYKFAGGRALVTLSSPPGEDGPLLDQWSLTPADAYDVHGWRAGRWWDKRRHIFSIAYEGKPARRVGIQSEPFGGGALVSATENKGELDDEAVCNGAVMSAIARQAWVHFSGEGVKVTNGLETDIGFHCAAKATWLLPRDVATYDQLHHSGDAWRNIRVFELMGDADVRVDGAVSGNGRFAYVADGPSGHHRLSVARGFVGKVCNTATAICEDVTRRVGEFLDLDWVRGRLIFGVVMP